MKNSETHNIGEKNMKKQMSLTKNTLALKKLFKICGSAAVMSLLTINLANAQATFDNGTLFVEATINDFCTVADSNLNFYADGSALEVNGTVDAQTSVTVDCSSDSTPWTLSFFGRFADSNNRVVTLPGGFPNPDDPDSPFDATISYDLYSDAGRTSILGNGDTTGTLPITGTGDQTVDVFGTLFAPDFQLPAGRYTGTEGMSVTF